ncbi:MULTISPECIES: glucose-1-phosphatase [unclassified Clostridium]|uniref:glucose-1-phosphatase n=1 Tax=unclassified Clostridium TaxID=2614128 RepID=UPI00207A6AA0|nr:MULTISPECIES: glucose-1-phosphatase [unclassified Clostridium]
MNIEKTRANLHLKIDQFGRGREEVQKASEEMDQKVLEEMLKQNPKIENNYLKSVIKAKDAEITNLQNQNLALCRSIQDLIELAVMNVEAGLTIQSALKAMQIIAVKEGIL